MHVSIDSTPNSEVPASIGGSQRTADVLLAVTSKCLRDFFAEPPQNLLPMCRVSLVEDGSLRSEQWSSILNRIKPDILVTGWSTPHITLRDIEEGGGSVRYICHLTGSIRSIISRSVIESGLMVSNWGALISHTVAEQAMLLTLACLRNLSAWPSVFSADSSRWAPMQRNLQTQSLRERRVGIHGFGSVARELVRYLQPYKTRIQACSEGVPADLMRQAGVIPCRDIEELFSNNDVVIECEALNEKTHGVISERLLRLLPPGGVFVNIGRGALVDEEALARVAAQRRLRVGLDVFTHEPLPANSPLWRIPGIVLSPHIAGPTLDWYVRCGQFAVENIRRFLCGDRPVALIDQTIYDRST